MIDVKGVFGRWYGGAGYAAGRDDNGGAVESFGTLDGARAALTARHTSGPGVMHPFEYVTRKPQAAQVGETDDRARIELCTVGIDAGRVVVGLPYAELTIGPRGGVVMTRYERAA